MNRVADIRFDRCKYGPHLLADACEVASLPSFITTPRLHRLAFWELALVTDGHGTLGLDGVPVEVAPYRLCITAPGEVRRWQLDGARLRGCLIFFDAELFEEAAGDGGFLQRLPISRAPAPQRSIALDRRRFEALAGLAGAMADELRSPDGDSPRMLRAQACQLLIAVQRASGVTARPVEDRAALLARRFAHLVDQRFAHGDAVSDYAERLGASVRHLNACVQRRTGFGAAETIRRRVFLEARRRLLADATPVTSIAEALGFADVPYFIRFFRRHSGVTPRAFRAAHGSAVVDRFSPLSGDDG